MLIFDILIAFVFVESFTNFSYFDVYLCLLGKHTESSTMKLDCEKVSSRAGSLAGSDNETDRRSPCAILLLEHLKNSCNTKNNNKNNQDKTEDDNDSEVENEITNDDNHLVDDDIGSGHSSPTSMIDIMPVETVFHDLDDDDDESVQQTQSNQPQQNNFFQPQGEFFQVFVCLLS